MCEAIELEFGGGFGDGLGGGWRDEVFDVEEDLVEVEGFAEDFVHTEIACEFAEDLDIADKDGESGDKDNGGLVALFAEALDELVPVHLGEKALYEQKGDGFFEQEVERFGWFVGNKDAISFGLKRLGESLAKGALAIDEQESWYHQRNLQRAERIGDGVCVV